MIFNIFFHHPTGVPCRRCGEPIVTCCTQEPRVVVQVNGTPDPFGSLHIAFERGDNGENLVHPAWDPDDKFAPHVVLFWRHEGKRPLYSLHICAMGGRVPARAGPRPSQ